MNLGRGKEEKIMKNIDLIATTTFGLEAVVKRELLNLGYEDLEVENGRVTVKNCQEKDIAVLNLWLRSAERVLVKVGEFKALTFDQLFEKTKALPWEEWITKKAEFPVEGKSINSKLFSISDSQAIVKKAIVERLKETYDLDWFEETGEKYTIEVSLLKDIATLTIDTSGRGLHKRGYRKESVIAPIKETLAAAMVQLSFWNKDRFLLDPFCGSGTICIEAAMIARNMAPGLYRNFAAEDWPRVKKEYWNEARREAWDKFDGDTELRIIGTDIDRRAVDHARENAESIGLEDDILFLTKDFREFDFTEEYGVIISNPPYGDRLLDEPEVHSLYRDMGNIFKALETYSVYIITSEKEFEDIYGKKADRKRKLYNGRIEVDYYQYYGPRPPRKE